MATVTITIPTAITQRVMDGFCKKYGYSPTLEGDEPNPETKAQFVKRRIIEHIKKAVRDSEIEDAVNIAAGSAGTSADTDITLS